MRTVASPRQGRIQGEGEHFDCYPSPVFALSSRARALLQTWALPGALLCALAAACTSEPAYLGVQTSSGGDGTGDDTAFCADECFIDDAIGVQELEIFRRSADDANPGDTSPAPTWEYPLPDSVHPSNLFLLTLHFRRSDVSQVLFEVVLEAPSGRRKFYIPCLSAGGNSCTYQVPERFWSEAAEQFAGESVTLTLRGASANTVSAPATLGLSFSDEAVEGGLYYWSSAGWSLYRLVFGGRQAVAYITPSENRCVGCHAVSRDGGTIAFTEGSAVAGAPIENNAAFDGGLNVALVTTPSSPSISPPPSGPSDSGMVTLSSKGARAVAAYDYGLTLRDTRSGETLDHVDQINGMTPFFPEYSPDNSALVVTLTDRIDSEIAVRGGGIYLISMTDSFFGEATELVPEEPGYAHYYPTWSPDGRWVAFVTGPVDGITNSKSYDEPNARLRLASVATGQVLELEAATGPPGSTSTWPKFAPFEQCANREGTCQPEERIFFLTFSSKRPYGVATNQPGDVRLAQLWMSSVSVNRAEAGRDPSSPPIWLPYQSLTSRNHLAYWTEALRCNAAYPCGPGLLCTSDGRCEINVR